MWRGNSLSYKHILYNYKPTSHDLHWCWNNRSTVCLCNFIMVENNILFSGARHSRYSIFEGNCFQNCYLLPTWYQWHRYHWSWPDFHEMVDHWTPHDLRKSIQPCCLCQFEIAWTCYQIIIKLKPNGSGSMQRATCGVALRQTTIHQTFALIDNTLYVKNAMALNTIFYSSSVYMQNYTYQQHAKDTMRNYPEVIWIYLFQS